MSGLPPGLVFGLQELALLQEIAIVPRSIGGIVATVTVREDHWDELIITEHPVEQGAAISDHAFKRPAQVIIEVGWVDGLDQNVSAIYDQLLQLQAVRQPFVIYTGKRIYQNMLISSLRAFTDEKTATTLLAQVICREVILVSTQPVSGVPAAKDPSEQTAPQSTAGSTDLGPQQLAPGTNFNPAGTPPSVAVDEGPPIGFSIPTQPGA